MVRKRLLSAAIVLLIAAAAVSIHAGKPVAVLLSCNGDVVVAKGNGTEVKGSFGLQLEDGDIVRTGGGADVEIHFSNGSWIHVGAGSDMHIKGPETKNVGTDSQQKEKSFERVQDFLKLKDPEGTTSLAMLRSVEKTNDLELESPCQTKIHRSPFAFRWKSSDPAEELKLTLYDENGILWEHTVKGTTNLSYPADAPELAPGITYSWTLETTDPLKFPPVRSTAAFFEILSPDEEKRLEADLEGIAEETIKAESAFHLARASVFFSYGLFEDAIEETQKVLEVDPENTALHAILARLYAEVGRTEEALAHYNLLLENR